MFYFRGIHSRLCHMYTIYIFFITRFMRSYFLLVILSLHLNVLKCGFLPKSTIQENKHGFTPIGLESSHGHQKLQAPEDAANFSSQGTWPFWWVSNLTNIEQRVFDGSGDCFYKFGDSSTLRTSNRNSTNGNEHLLPWERRTSIVNVTSSNSSPGCDDNCSRPRENERTEYQQDKSLTYLNLKTRPHNAGKLHVWGGRQLATLMLDAYVAHEVEELPEEAAFGEAKTASRRLLSYGEELTDAYVYDTHSDYPGHDHQKHDKYEDKNIITMEKNGNNIYYYEYDEQPGKPDNARPRRSHQYHDSDKYKSDEKGDRVKPTEHKRTAVDDTLQPPCLPLSIDDGDDDEDYEDEQESDNEIVSTSKGPPIKPVNEGKEQYEDAQYDQDEITVTEKSLPMHQHTKLGENVDSDLPLQNTRLNKKKAKEINNTLSKEIRMYSFLPADRNNSVDKSKLKQKSRGFLSKLQQWTGLNAKARRRDQDKLMRSNGEKEIDTPEGMMILIPNTTALKREQATAMNEIDYDYDQDEVIYNTGISRSRPYIGVPSCYFTKEIIVSVICIYFNYEDFTM